MDVPLPTKPNSRAGFRRPQSHIFVEFFVSRTTKERLSLTTSEVATALFDKPLKAIAPFAFRGADERLNPRPLFSIRLAPDNPRPGDYPPR